MKFNKHISSELQELLITQLKEYIKTTPMTRKELRAVRDWVKDGHSVYESMSGAFYDGQTLWSSWQNGEMTNTSANIQNGWHQKKPGGLRFRIMAEMMKMYQCNKAICLIALNL